VIYVLWRSRILPLLYHRRDEGMALLISRHRDGGYLAELSERWGYRVVRGSSQRGGEAGLLGLVRYLRQGGEVALTPDGPRGPAERMKPGGLAVGRVAGRTPRTRAAHPPRGRVLDRHEAACGAEPRRLRPPSLADDRGRESVSRGYGENAARGMDRGLLCGARPHARHLAPRLRRGRAACASAPRAAGGRCGEPRSRGGRGRPSG